MTLPAGYFDDLYAADGDPWGFRTRWYEQRKYSVSLAALPRPRYRSAFEPGASIGVFTALLAGRCDRVLATDPARAAIDRAAKYLTDHHNVELRCGGVPADWPAGVFDLIVISELGYYLDAADLDRLAARAVGCLEPGGDLLAVHWRWPVADYPLTGDAVHAALHRTAGLEGVVRHEEKDFVLDVFRRVPPGARSVAEIEGLR